MELNNGKIFKLRYNYLRTLYAEKNQLENPQTFTNIPEHKAIMIEAKLELSPKYWEGQALYVKLDNEIAWLQHFDLKSK
jgi:hypothetical protein